MLSAVSCLYFSDNKSLVGQKSPWIKDVNFKKSRFLSVLSYLVGVVFSLHVKLLLFLREMLIKNSELHNKNKYQAMPGPMMKVCRKLRSNPVLCTWVLLERGWERRKKAERRNKLDLSLQRNELQTRGYKTDLLTLLECVYVYTCVHTCHTWRKQCSKSSTLNLQCM